MELVATGLLKNLHGLKKGQTERGIEEYNTTRTCLAQEDQDTQNVSIQRQRNI